MDEITYYIFNYRQDLLAIEENKAYRHLTVLQNIEFVESETQREMMRKWLSTDENVLKLLENGSEQFYKRTVERVFKDNLNKEVLNLCPKCNSLARTPKSKQCPKCFYSWQNKI
jgi:rubrerythrin